LQEAVLFGKRIQDANGNFRFYIKSDGFQEQFPLASKRAGAVLLNTKHMKTIDQKSTISIKGRFRQVFKFAVKPNMADVSAKLMKKNNLVADEFLG